MHARARARASLTRIRLYFACACACIRVYIRIGHKDSRSNRDEMCSSSISLQERSCRVYRMTIGAIMTCTALGHSRVDYYVAVKYYLPSHLMWRFDTKFNESKKERYKECGEKWRFEQCTLRTMVIIFKTSSFVHTTYTRVTQMSCIVIIRNFNCEINRVPFISKTS